MSFFCFETSTNVGSQSQLIWKILFHEDFHPQTAPEQHKHTPRKELACVDWVAKVLSGLGAEAVKASKPIGDRMQLQLPTASETDWQNTWKLKILSIFIINVLWAVWHFPLSKRSNWKTRITAIIKKETESQKTPVTILPLSCLPVASPWPQLCT